jgi:CRISPR system Cascade subunit CasA
LDVLRRARDIERITGSPPESAAILRLLVAIAHTVGTPQDEFEWVDIWNGADRRQDQMVAYTERHADSFNLYDPQRPFSQHPNLEPGSATPAALVYERARGNNAVLLDHSRTDCPQPVTSAQAARALLVAHAYGGSGTGSNNPLNGGKKDQMLAGPLCARLIATLQSQDLLKTILLNLTANVRAGLPAWERTPPNGPGKSYSDGVADLYTRNSRAVRLTPDADGSHCVAAAIFQGEGVITDETAPPDPMIPRYMASDRTYKPLRLNPDRVLWRDADVLLAATETEKAIPIRAIAQLRALANHGLISDKEISLRILGVAADAQGPVTTLWRDEALMFGLSVIADDARYTRLAKAVRAADEHATRTRGRIYGFAQRYLQNGSSASADPQAVAVLADELSPNLTEFWSTLAAAGRRVACDDFNEQTWAALLQNAAEGTFRRAASRLPPDARRFRAEYATQSKVSSKKKGADK